jgi:hypothetical protein
MRIGTYRIEFLTLAGMGIVAPDQALRASVAGLIAGRNLQVIEGKSEPLTECHSN